MNLLLPSAHRIVNIRVGKLLFGLLVLPALCFVPDLATGQGEMRGFLGIEVEPLTQPISTERPNFSTSPVPLASGHQQIEIRFQYTQTDSDMEGFTVPQALFRVGLARNLELQIGWAGYSFTDINGDSITGANDITVALKAQVTEQEGYLPTLGLLGKLSLPTGSGEFSSDSVDPSLGVLWAYHLQDANLFGTVSFSSLTDEEDERFFQTGIAAGVGFPIGGGFSGYIEYFGVFSERGEPAHIIDVGLPYLVNRNLQLDAVVGVGLNEAAPDYFAGAGVSYRW